LGPAADRTAARLEEIDAEAARFLQLRLAWYRLDSSAMESLLQSLASSQRFQTAVALAEADCAFLERRFELAATLYSKFLEGRAAPLVSARQAVALIGSGRHREALAILEACPRYDLIVRVIAKRAANRLDRRSSLIALGVLAVVGAFALASYNPVAVGIFVGACLIWAAWAGRRGRYVNRALERMGANERQERLSMWAIAYRLMRRNAQTL
jgi:hypothetical protein